MMMARQVGVVGTAAQHVGIAVDRIVHGLRTEPENRNDLPRVELVARCGDDACLIQLDRAVCQHPGMNAQVFCTGIPKQRPNRAPNRALFYVVAILIELARLLQNESRATGETNR